MSRPIKINRKQKPVAFRRKRDGQTDYRKRLRLILSNKPRLVFRKSIKYVWLQLATYNEKGDLITVSAHSKELKKLGWKGSCNNTPAAYLTGLLFAKKTKEIKVTGVIADNGLYATVAKSTFYGALKGVVDGGLNIPVSEEVFPSEDRLNGSHIKAYAEQLQGDKLKKQFASQDVLNITDNFDEVKKKIA